MTITELLDRSRRELLDLSTRNRLLAVPLEARTARLVRVVDELSREVYRILVEEKRSMSFLPCREGSEEESLPQPEEASAAGAAARRHRDARLQTDLSSSGLQTRLQHAALLQFQQRLAARQAQLHFIDGDRGQVLQDLSPRRIKAITWKTVNHT